MSSTAAAPRTVEFEWMSISTWHQKHDVNVTQAEKGDADILFIGDSITEGWTWGENQQIFDATFGQYKTANFGIGGDQTQHVLWRLRNGESGNLNPKLTVLLIGTNNFGHSHHTPSQVAEGVTGIINELKTAFPSTKILLIGVYPFDHLATSESRVKVAKTNQLIAQLNDNQTIFYYDFGSLFINERGNIPQSLMSDYLHPSNDGYALLATKLGPIVDSFMQPTTRNP
ncbi:GDSL-type esterase/lipase family protein [Teredinibacter purpureus]|uniref:GDSL-type esterase/lipase family protein n=1 Tax=Teredinibacter purpureus TaxID=2731756 RepID=UPI0013C4A419|nr:GDSL-type esterase/lipase family protein [Teredinibacter purpureus]